MTTKRVLASTSATALVSAMLIATHGQSGSVASAAGAGGCEPANGTRELVISPLPYIVVYKVLGDIIFVVRILHGAQKWP